MCSLLLCTAVGEQGGSWKKMGVAEKGSPGD